MSSSASEYIHTLSQERFRYLAITTSIKNYKMRGHTELTFLLLADLGLV